TQRHQCRQSCPFHSVVLCASVRIVSWPFGAGLVFARHVPEKKPASSDGDSRENAVKLRQQYRCLTSLRKKRVADRRASRLDGSPAIRETRSKMSEIHMAEQHVAERARRHADGARNFARDAAAIRYVAEHFDEPPPLATVRIPS